MTDADARHLEAWRQIQTGELLSDAFRRYLTPWELRFVVDIHLWEIGLSQKQADCLTNVIHNVMAKHGEALTEKAEAEAAALEPPKDLGGDNVIAFPKQPARKPKKARATKRDSKESA